MINNIFRFSQLISSKDVESIVSFLKNESDYLNPITIRSSHSLNDKYDIEIFISGLSVGSFHSFCQLEISIFKNENTLLKQKFSAYSTLELFKIKNVESDDSNVYLIKLEEDSDDNIKVLKRTFNDLKYRTNYYDEALIDQLMFKSFSDKIQGMELCYTLIVSNNKHLYEDGEIRNFLISSLEFVGYDEDFFDNYEKRDDDSSLNIFKNTLYLILEVIYTKKKLNREHNKALAYNRAVLFINALVEENY